MRIVVLVALLAACGKDAGTKDRCVALMKKEQTCVPTSGVEESKLGVSMCMLQFDDRQALDGADQRLAARYAALLACSEKTRTCDEYLACACKDPTTYATCAAK